MHRKNDVPIPSDRSFGFVFSLIFFVLSGILWWNHEFSWQPIGSAVIGGIFLLLASWKPRLLSPLNRGWAHLGYMIHRIVNPLILGVLYFVLIVPVGLAMRMLGRDVLRLKKDCSAGTYWINREKSKVDPESFIRQF